MAVKKSVKASAKPKRKTSGKAKAKAKPRSKAKPSRAQRKVAKPKKAVGAKAKAAEKPAVKAARKPAKKPAKKKTAAKVSPLAPKAYAKLPPIGGVELGAVAAGIKYKGRTDLLVAKMAEGTQVAGVFTTSKTASAPVEWCRNNVGEGGEGRMLVVNSGNSNAFTGKAGVATVKATAAAAAQAGNCRQKDVFIASTGVIGQPIDAAKLDAVLVVKEGDRRGARFGLRRQVGRGRPRHHDDRHLSENGDPQGQDRRRRGFDQRYRQGLRHDRA